MAGVRKVALITGAGSGIGAGTAVLLAVKGYRLALNDLRPDRLEDVKKTCQEAGLGPDDTILVPGDGRDAAVVQAAVQETVNKLGQLDLLVNSAGVYKTKNTMTATMEDYDLIMDTNAKAVVMWCREAVPHLIKTKGNIVNVGSIASVCPREASPFYCMSKAAVAMFTRCLSNELGPQGVRVNAVNPGAVETNIYENTGNTKDEYLKMLNRWKEKVPLRMTGSVDDVVHAIEYLSSDQARFITGTSINIDGGGANQMESP